MLCVSSILGDRTRRWRIPSAAVFSIGGPYKTGAAALAVAGYLDIRLDAKPRAVFFNPSFEVDDRLVLRLRQFIPAKEGERPSYSSVALAFRAMGESTRACAAVEPAERLRHLFGRGDLPASLALGAGGIWPLALPFLVKIRQRIGAPIRLGRCRRTPTPREPSRPHTSG
jgi:hypothetical protein